MAGGNGDAPGPLGDDLAELGFKPQGVSRRGGRMWALAFNRFLTFNLHEYAVADDRRGRYVVLTWSHALGEYLLERGWVIGAGETSFQELYPQRDARLAADVVAVEAEITRVLSTLRLDLGDPSL